MILFKTPAKAVGDNEFPRAKSRWVIETGLWKWGFSLDWVRQVTMNGDRNKFRSLHSESYGFSITSSFNLGTHHYWYDGPHCHIDLGFLHINYNNFDCQKCDQTR